MKRYFGATRNNSWSIGNGCALCITKLRALFLILLTGVIFNADADSGRWCGLASEVLQIPDAKCLEKNGVPLDTERFANWVMTNYFGKWKEHKAFAISEGSFGFSGWRASDVDAKRQALLDCNLRARDATTCRVVNINGRHQIYQDIATSSDPAFSSQGLLSDISGRYSVEFNYQGIDGTLKVKEKGTNVSVIMEVCLENLCSNYELIEGINVLRGRYFGGTMKLKTARGSWPNETRLRASISSDTARIIGFFAPYTFEGNRVSD